MGNKTALILMNLGTPDTPEPKAVRHFLGKFLSDKRVVALPRFLWIPLLYCIVLPLRSKKVTMLYRSIWQQEGSPLLLNTQNQVKKIQAYLDINDVQNAGVHFAMTYSEPSLESVVKKLCDDGVKSIVVIPLYPQFSWTTTGAVMDQIKQLNSSVEIMLVDHYFDEDLYIKALAESIRKHWQEKGRGEKLLLSFHGIPQANIEKGDPYYHHCLQTFNLLRDYLSLTESECQISFQSRFGFAKWVGPYTKEILKKWGESGIQRVDVICPSFASDCLETLEEISVECKQQFILSGGKKLKLISCLNDDDIHIELLANIFSKK